MEVGQGPNWGCSAKEKKILLGRLYQICHFNNEYRFYKQYVYLFLINNFVTVQ
jgi:hypothetical protein